MATPKLPLKTGDQVVCLDNKGIDSLTKGKRYEVRGVYRGGTQVTIVSDIGTTVELYRYRFRKVTQRAKAGFGTRRSHKSKKQQTETKIKKLQGIMTMDREKAIKTVLGMICDELKAKL